MNYHICYSWVHVIIVSKNCCTFLANCSSNSTYNMQSTLLTQHSPTSLVTTEVKVKVTVPPRWVNSKIGRKTHVNKNTVTCRLPRKQGRSTTVIRIRRRWNYRITFNTQYYVVPVWGKYLPSRRQIFLLNVTLRYDMNPAIVSFSLCYMEPPQSAKTIVYYYNYF